MTRLAIERMTKRFGDVPAVSNLDLAIEPGQFVVLLGPSGCGKTTTLRCIAGLEDISEGRILMDGTAVSLPNGSVPPEQRSIGMVFQSYAIWPHMNVFGNVAYGVKLQKLSKSDTENRVNNALAMVGLTGYEKRAASALSGGQQQRVALARAVALEPKVLLFDEPLSNLDAKLRQKMRLEIRALQRRLGITAIYVTHDQEEAMVIADQIVLMRDGRIEQQGTPQEIYHRPSSIFSAEFVGSANVLPAVVGETIGGSAEIVLKPNLKLVGVETTARTGATVDLVIRPEHVSIATEAPGNDSNVMRGTAAECVFLGVCSEVTIDVGGLTIRAHCAPAKLFRPGTPIWLSFAPAHAVVLGRRES
jgi:iron(III) transport system ATP-binding protein